MVALRTLPFFQREESNQKLDNELGLIDYLRSRPFNEALPISKSGEVSFHWGDWRESLNLQRDIVRGQQDKRDSELQEIITFLKDQPAWINNKIETKKMNLYDLYLSYQNTAIRDLWFSSEANKFYISLHGETGPYVPLTSMRWFDKEIYAKLVYRKLLDATMSERNFRIGYSTPLICHLDTFIIDPHHFWLHQLTKGGMLLKIQGVDAFNKFLISEYICLEFAPKIFHYLGRCKSVKEFKKVLVNENPHLSMADKRDKFRIHVRSVINKYRNIDNLKAAQAQEYYIFIPWEDVAPVGKEEGLGDLMKYFLAGTELLFNTELD